VEVTRTTVNHAMDMVVTHMHRHSRHIRTPMVANLAAVTAIPRAERIMVILMEERTTDILMEERTMDILMVERTMDILMVERTMVTLTEETMKIAVMTSWRRANTKRVKTIRTMDTPMIIMVIRTITMVTLIEPEGDEDERRLQRDACVCCL